MKMNKNESNFALKIKVAAFGLALAILSGCGGAPVQEVEIEKPQFKVTDASPGGREAWLENPNLYAKKEGLDTDHFTYYTGDAQSADKRMACENAQANVVDDVSKQVSTFVNSSIARASTDSTSNDSVGMSASSASSTETSRISSQLSKTLVAGVEKYKQYWEQRDYSAAGGAKSLYYCWVLGKIDQKTIAQMVERAKTIRFREDPQLKEKVDGKLGNIEKEFEKYMQAH